MVSTFFGLLLSSTIFVSFIGGVWADRYNRKYLIIGADALIAVVTLAMLLAMPHTLQQNLCYLAALLVMSIIRSAGAGIQIRLSMQLFRSSFQKNILGITY